jgi:hypothetical protein
MPDTAPTSTTPTAGARGTSGWVGWVAFAGVLMLFLGVLHLVQGLVALLDASYFGVRSSVLLIDLGWTAFGWVHVVAGVVVLAAGYGIFAGAAWARVVGVVVALASAVTSLALLAAYPVWAVLTIALDVVVVMALTVHGAEIRTGR